jgi:hypothetical protein
VQVHLGLADQPQLERREQPQALQILFLVEAGGAAVGLLVHLAQPHAQVALAALVAVALLVVACIFMLHQRLPSLVPLGQDLLAFRAAEAEQVDQSLLQAAAQQPTMPLHYR